MQRLQFSLKNTSTIFYNSNVIEDIFKHKITKCHFTNMTRESNLVIPTKKKARNARIRLQPIQIRYPTRK